MERAAAGLADVCLQAQVVCGLMLCAAAWLVLPRRLWHGEAEVMMVQI